MCGRYSNILDPEQIRQMFGLEYAEPSLAMDRSNIAPTQSGAVVLLENGRRTLAAMRWGLVPGWAKDLSFGSKTFNARGETVAEKPSFRSAFKSRRCLVVSDGFYEWTRLPGDKHKTPIKFTLRDSPLLAMAGLWESWKSPEGERIRTYTIVTTTPNELVGQYHHRMAVILDAPQWEAWLDPKTPPDTALAMIAPYPPERMQAAAAVLPSGRRPPEQGSLFEGAPE